ncbi:unnamed protein product [Parajaminaea phylloscopi]
MFAPRARTHHDENALSTRTPGPSLHGPRHTASPLKMRQGKTNKLSDGPSAPRTASPKKGLKSATPGPSNSMYRSALGDKTNNNKTPFERSGGDAGKSPSKGKGLAHSLKSPQKMQQTPASVATKTPATRGPHPRIGGGAFRSLQRVQSFETPAANIGRKGMMKQRLGELMDAERMMASGSGASPTEDGPSLEQGQAQTLQADGLTEEDLYPEIEYMPPSITTAGEPAWEPPAQLEELPRATQLAEALAKADFVRAVGAWHGSSLTLAPDIVIADTERFDHREAVQRASKLRTEDEELYPDVITANKTALVARPVSSRSTSSVSSRASAAGSQMTRMCRPPVAPAAPKQDVRCRLAPATSRSTTPASVVSSASSGQANRVRPVAGTQRPATTTLSSRLPKSTPQPSVKTASTAHSQRSVGTQQQANRNRSAGIPARPASLQPARTMAQGQSSAPVVRQVRQLHPALRDLYHDDLGQVIDAQLRKIGEQEVTLAGPEDLSLDSDSEDEATVA